MQNCLCAYRITLKVGGELSECCAPGWWGTRAQHAAGERASLAFERPQRGEPGLADLRSLRLPPPTAEPQAAGEGMGQKPHRCAGVDAEG